MPIDLDTLPRYESHKNVGALEVAEVGNYTTAPDGSVVRRVTFTNGNYADLPEVMFARYVPSKGDFLVFYENAYQSFSPRQVFLDGYSPVGKSFAEIRDGLKIGRPPRSDLASAYDGGVVPITSAAHPADPKWAKEGE